MRQHQKGIEMCALYNEIREKERRPTHDGRLFTHLIASMCVCVCVCAILFLALFFEYVQRCFVVVVVVFFFFFFFFARLVVT